MRFRLSDVREEPFTWSETRHLDAASFDDPRLAGLGEISWNGEVTYAAPMFLLRASVNYPRQLVCDRCLELFADEVNEEFTLLVNQGPGRGDGEHELVSADLDTLEVEGDEVDLEPLLLEQVVLAVPHRPLCERPQCAVPGGFADKSVGDPRWAALEKMRERLDPDRG
jgi:uncharacterized protein